MRVAVQQMVRCRFSLYPHVRKSISWQFFEGFLAVFVPAVVLLIAVIIYVCYNRMQDLRHVLEIHIPLATLSLFVSDIREHYDVITNTSITPTTTTLTTSLQSLLPNPPQ